MFRTGFFLPLSSSSIVQSDQFNEETNFIAIKSFQLRNILFYVIRKDNGKDHFSFDKLGKGYLRHFSNTYANKYVFFSSFTCR